MPTEAEPGVTGGEGGCMTSPCVLFANEPLAYRTAMAGAVGVMRPDLDVRVVAPDDLAAEIARRRPRFVVCSAPSDAVRARVPAWLVLSPDGASVVACEFPGEPEELDDVDLAGILALVDRATNPATGPISCRPPASR
jgi:hypothetical protein